MAISVCGQWRRLIDGIRCGMLSPGISIERERPMSIEFQLREKLRDHRQLNGGGDRNR